MRNPFRRKPKTVHPWVDGPWVLWDSAQFGLYNYPQVRDCNDHTDCFHCRTSDGTETHWPAHRTQLALAADHSTDVYQWDAEHHGLAEPTVGSYWEPEG